MGEELSYKNHSVEKNNAYLPANVISVTLMYFSIFVIFTFKRTSAC